ncbi:hypothetical protein [Paenibacillus sp. FSL K6-0108]|uniref:hypothetical protein n=1 Tax=Paenibacillus sp. FSL K6-0108 TaxID=2921417 RepID=UPI003244D613
MKYIIGGKNNIFKKILIISIALLLLSVLLVGCSNTIPNQGKIIEEATQVGQKYFIDEYSTEVEFTDHKFMPKDLSHNIGLSGHVKSNEDTEITILIDYDTFRVQNAIVPKELLNKKKN